MTSVLPRSEPTATQPVAPYDLDDRYRVGAGPVLLTGVQAIARMLVEQHVRDLRAGSRVATFVSGYQGSPLGGVDKMLLGMPNVLAEHDVVFTPGFNEEIINRIADDLTAVCRPQRLEARGEFAPRGGISLTVEASYPEP